MSLSQKDREAWLTALKGWALGLADSIDKYGPQILANEPLVVDNHNAEADGRAKLARLVREISEIHNKIVAEVYT